MSVCVCVCVCVRAYVCGRVCVRVWVCAYECSNMKLKGIQKMIVFIVELFADINSFIFYYLKP